MCISDSPNHEYCVLRLQMFLDPTLMNSRTPGRHCFRTLLRPVPSTDGPSLYLHRERDRTKAGTRPDLRVSHSLIRLAAKSPAITPMMNLGRKLKVEIGSRPSQAPTSTWPMPTDGSKDLHSHPCLSVVPPPIQSLSPPYRSDYGFFHSTVRVLLY